MTEEDIFDIDKHRLDEELLKQAQLMHEYSTKVADAEKELSLKTAELKLVEAELSKEMRHDPVKFDIPKVTEGSIESAIIAHKRFRRVKGEVIEAQHEVDVLKAFVAGIRDRKVVLENLVQLFLSDYWSEPRIKSAPRQQIEENGKNQTSNRIKQKLNRK